MTAKTSETQLVLQASSGDISVLTLNRPETRNAMSDHLVTTLLDMLDTLADDAVCRAIILTGSGSGFCAGSDLRNLARMPPNDQRLFEEKSGFLARRIAAMPVPVIAAVTGFAIGGGLTLAASCDIIISQPGAKWSLPEVPIGLFPAWGLWAVEARIGRTNAQRLSWGIDTLDAGEALRLGLVDIIDSNPLAKAVDIASRLAVLPTKQVSQVKSYFLRSFDGNAHDEHANRLFMDAASSPAAAETFKRYRLKS